MNKVIFLTKIRNLFLLTNYCQRKYYNRQFHFINNNVKIHLNAMLINKSCYTRCQPVQITVEEDPCVAQCCSACGLKSTLYNICHHHQNPNVTDAYELAQTSGHKKVNKSSDWIWNIPLNLLNLFVTFFWTFHLKVLLWKF